MPSQAAHLAHCNGGGAPRSLPCRAVVCAGSGGGWKSQEGRRFCLLGRNRGATGKGTAQMDGGWLFCPASPQGLTQANAVSRGDRRPEPVHAGVALGVRLPQPLRFHDLQLPRHRQALGTAPASPPMLPCLASQSDHLAGPSRTAELRLPPAPFIGRVTSSRRRVNFRQRAEQNQTKKKKKECANSKSRFFLPRERA